MAKLKRYYDVLVTIKVVDPSQLKGTNIEDRENSIKALVENVLSDVPSLFKVKDVRVTELAKID